MEELKKNIELCKKLYDYINHNIEEMENDFENDYLTINKGKNGKEYIWYTDENNNIAIDIVTGELITDEEELQKIFNY